MNDREVKSAQLELAACALWKQYGFFLPKTAKGFFNELAEFLGWQYLGKMTK